nr:MAG TPA: hypothetical protein [Caudoviricetes sp.]
MIAGVGFKADVPAVCDSHVRRQQRTDERILDLHIILAAEQGQPYFLRIDARTVVCMEVKAVRERRQHKVGVRCCIGEDTCLNRHAAAFRDGIQFRQQTHSFSTSSLSVCSMTRMHSTLAADFAGFRKGLGGWPDFPYSRMLAIFALLPPSERGSEKPILMSWLPSRFSLTGDRPSDCVSSPVERESYFVPLPMTAARLLRTFARTTCPPASSTFSATLSVSLPRRDSFVRNSSGSLKSAFANSRFTPFR